GPTLIEVLTLRMWGHFEGDAQGYRPDLADVPGLDPIPRYEQRLRRAGILDDEAVRAVKDAATEQVEDAVAYAKDSPRPDPTDVFRYVLAEEQSCPPTPPRPPPAGSTPPRRWSRPSARRCSATRPSSTWARTSGSTAASSPPPPTCSARS